MIGQEKKSGMKKLFVIALSLLLVLALTACTGQGAGTVDEAVAGGEAVTAEAADDAAEAPVQGVTTQETDAEPAASAEEAVAEDATGELPTADAGEASAQEGDTAQAGSHILVVCFSATDHTRPLAKAAAEYLGADYFELEAAEPYTEEDLNYNDSHSRTSLEQNDDTCRPAMAGDVENMDAYDTIIIAHPIWWGQAPKIIYTFVESHDLSGKTLVTMCTSASSGLGTSAKNLQAAVDGEVTWLESRRFAIGTDAAAVQAWLDEIGLHGEA